MLYLYTGTDREKTRGALGAAVQKAAKKARVVRVSDANTSDDLRAVLQGGGMFEDSRIVVLDSVLGNEEMRTILREALPAIRASADTFFMLEEKPDAETRRFIEKYAEESERFDMPAKKRESTIFALANALRRSDRKALWVGYQRELAGGSAPEAIHGVLFWAVKDMFMKSTAGAPRARAEKLIAVLAELPHEARRRGEDLEYALERFVLSGA